MSVEIPKLVRQESSGGNRGVPDGAGAAVGDKESLVRLVPVALTRKKVAGIGRNLYQLTSDEKATIEFEGPVDLDIPLHRPLTLARRDGRLVWIETGGARRELTENVAPGGGVPLSVPRWPWLLAWLLAMAALVLMAWLYDRWGLP